jgi:hypothetical protein
MVFQTPNDPTSLFAADVTPERLSTQIQAGNPATYISSITYGRQFYLLLESTASAQDLEASLKVVVAGGVTKVAGNLAMTYKSTESQTNVKAYALGGSADATLGAALQATSGNLEGLAGYLTGNANFDSNNPGLPLSYVVRDANTNQIVAVNVGGQYAKQTCIPVVKPDNREVLWLDANDLPANTTTMTTWPGKSQATNDGTGQAAYDATGINGKPAVSFTATNGPGGGGGAFTIDLGNGNVVQTDYTLVAVVKTLNGTNTNYFLQGGSPNVGSGDDTQLIAGWEGGGTFLYSHNGNDCMSPSVSPSAAGDIITLRFVQGQNQGGFLYVNGNYRANNGNQQPLLSNRLQQLGSGVPSASGEPYSAFVGMIGEVRAFNYGLTDPQRVTVECELSGKWGLPVANCVNGMPDPTAVTY